MRPEPDSAASERRFEVIFQESPLGIALVDSNFRLIRANRRFCELLGYSEAELARMRNEELIHPEDLDSDREDARRLFAGETSSYRTEKRYLTRQGNAVWLSLISSTVRDASGALLYVLGIFDLVEPTTRPGKSHASGRRSVEDPDRSRARELAATRDRLIAAEREKRQFFHEILRAVTHDKLWYVERSELPEPGGVPVLETAVEGPDATVRVRATIRRITAAAQVDDTRQDDFLLAVGEAIGNGVRHAHDVRCAIYRTNERVIARVSDAGSGIHAASLPASLLRSGFSSIASLGMGFTLMLRCADRVWLSTGSTGTIIQLEQRLSPASEDEDDPLLMALERF